MNGLQGQTQEGGEGRRRRRRRIRFGSVRRPGANINVTPLVDVVLVLLIIFMVATPLEERRIDMRLAQEETAQKQDAVPPEQVIVTVHREALRVNDRIVERSEYISSLRALLAQRDPADRVVFVSASDTTSYRELIEVIDSARAAGAAEVGLVSEEAPAAGDTPSE